MWWEKPEQWFLLSGDRRVGWRLTEKEHEGTVGGNGHVPHLVKALHCRGGVCICQNSG